MVDITLNGEPRRLEGDCRLDGLVAALALSGQALAIAVNRQVVPRRDWQDRLLRDADRVDIVRAIGGG